MDACVERVVSWLRRLIAPSGRHRAARRPLDVPLPSLSEPVRQCRHPRCTLAPTVQAWYEPIDGASTGLVRPYLAAHEREEKARIQRLRRYILWCAMYGVDLDNRNIHAGLGAA
ncbi:hypothetical protein [Streptomyces adelaidensis]|uniref:hypothetical protein n=1 Tax=Streptomyces adelaidensis TaxID=2796465 RepID=UPI0019076166|nr:hypothetical protein [Streptomyces adelaidensis]